jgi:hypothetical protein
MAPFESAETISLPLIQIQRIATNRDNSAGNFAWLSELNRVERRSRSSHRGNYMKKIVASVFALSLLAGAGAASAAVVGVHVGAVGVGVGVHHHHHHRHQHCTWHHHHRVCRWY